MHRARGYELALVYGGYAYYDADDGRSILVVGDDKVAIWDEDDAPYFASEFLDTLVGIHLGEVDTETVDYVSAKALHNAACVAEQWGY